MAGSEVLEVESAVFLIFLEVGEAALADEEVEEAHVGAVEMVVGGVAVGHETFEVEVKSINHPHPQTEPAH